MSNSSNSEPRARINADPQRLDLAPLGDGVIIIIKGNVRADSDLKTVKVKDGAVFNVRATD